MSDEAKPPVDEKATENTTLQVARTAGEVREKGDRKVTGATDKSPSIGWKTAAGIGIGSAALVAALLYSRRR